MKYEPVIERRGMTMKYGRSRRLAVTLGQKSREWSLEKWKEGRSLCAEEGKTKRRFFSEIE